VEVCPQSAPLRPSGAAPPGPHRPASCLLCGACVQACPAEARELAGRTVTADQLVRELLADRVFYEQSGGGVTVSGGEPLAQFEFLRAFLQRCEETGLRTAVDTCGFTPWEHLLAIAPLTGLFLYDLKFVDDARHRQFTGVSNQLILDNLRALAGVHQDIWLRIPIIPGVNDTPGELEAMAGLAALLPSVRQVNLLPYHRTGLQKFRRLGRESPLLGVTPPSVEYLEAVAARFAGAGTKVRVGG
jgi:pyruvate formate lyase activating enzyme